MVVELLLILLLVAFAAYGRVIGNDFPRFFLFFFFFFFFFKIVNANSSNGLVISLENCWLPCCQKRKRLIEGLELTRDKLGASRLVL